MAGHDVPTGSTLLPLPMIPAMSAGRCGSGSSTVPAVPVAWGAQGLYTLVAREPVIVPANVAARPSGVLPAPAAPVDGAYVQGSPRSPSGGFLIVPTLVLFARIPIQQAVGTSLLVICMSSVAGFAGHLGHASVHWGTTLAVTDLRRGVPLGPGPAAQRGQGDAPHR